MSWSCTKLKIIESENPGWFSSVCVLCNIFNNAVLKKKRITEKLKKKTANKNLKSKIPILAAWWSFKNGKQSVRESLTPCMPSFKISRISNMGFRSNRFNPLTAQGEVWVDTRTLCMAEKWWGGLSVARRTKEEGKLLKLRIFEGRWANKPLDELQDKTSPLFIAFCFFAQNFSHILSCLAWFSVSFLTFTQLPRFLSEGEM